MRFLRLFAAIPTAEFRMKGAGGQDESLRGAARTARRAIPTNSLILKTAIEFAAKRHKRLKNIGASRRLEPRVAFTCRGKRSGLHPATNTRSRPMVEWHMSCDIRRKIENMATKAILLMELLQESRGCEQITNRCPIPHPSVLYLMQLRAQTGQPSVSKQRLAITADWQNNAEFPLSVKINHIKPGECEPPVVFI